MRKYTVVDHIGKETVVEADSFDWNGNCDRLAFGKNGRNIAAFNTKNIIGFYETKEGARE